MSEMTFHEYKKKDIENAMVVISFPTIGLISTIVTNLLITNLGLERIAAIISDDFYPAAIINNGVPMPPVRIYAGDNECGPDGSCDQLVVITSELPVKPEAFSALADSIIDWCEEKGCKVVVTIEGLNRKEPAEDDKLEVLHAGSTKKALKMFEGLKTRELENGMVSGLSGLLLYKGNIRDFDVTCLLAGAHSDYPDSRSAAEVLKVLDEMVPQIKMDAEPLLKQVMYLEEQMKKAMTEIAPKPPVELTSPAGMYG